MLSMMKRTIFYPLLALLMLIPFTGFGQQAKEPKISIAKTEHNFGEVNKGETVSHTFVFKNEGEADLLIRNVAPS